MRSRPRDLASLRHGLAWRYRRARRRLRTAGGSGPGDPPAPSSTALREDSPPDDAGHGPPHPTAAPHVQLTRSDLFGNGFTERTLEEFCGQPTVEWIYDERPDTETPRPNPFRSATRPDLLASILKGQRWRHHHHIPELIAQGDLYTAYVQRVETMLTMCDDALDALGVTARLHDLSAVDLACAEGFVANHYLNTGLRSVDCFELNQGCIERFGQVQALRGITGARLGRIDLENARWGTAIGPYDIVFALGIIYHLENPLLFARNLYRITGEVALVESDTPLTADANRFRGHGVIYLHRDQVTLEAGNVRQLVEFRPDRLALAQLLVAAGFSEVYSVAAPGASGESRYFSSGEKSLLVCRK